MWEWSIGIYTGTSPFDLVSPKEIENPVLSAKDVTDVAAAFVADPFIVREDSTWYMFFEVMNARTVKGEIGLATSEDGFNWTYQRTVLCEAFHLSYPYIINKDNEYDMVPETSEVSSVRLYKAIQFPTRWEFVATLLSGARYVDPSIFLYKDKWWMFVGTRSNDTLYLWCAHDLLGPWVEHAASPVVRDNLDGV